MKFAQNEWALILGASSGLAVRLQLNLHDVNNNIFGVHLDRQATMPVQRILKEINIQEQSSVYNINADSIKRNEHLTILRACNRNFCAYNVLVHSLAFEPQTFYCQKAR